MSIERLAPGCFNAPDTAAHVPGITAVKIATTRPFSRCLRTVAYFSSSGTTARTSRCSASWATKSHQPPLWSSAGSLGSQFFCFLATNDQISSSWTSRVSGGKSHEFVVGVPGVLAGLAGQPHVGVSVDADEPLGLADPVALDQMLEEGGRLPGGQARMGQRSAFALGEARLARLAVEQSDVVVLAVAVADREIPGVATAVERAIGILAAETREVVHGWGPSREDADRRSIGRNPQGKYGLNGPQ